MPPRTSATGVPDRSRLINQQLQALRTQLAMLNAALEAAEAQAEESQVQIADLGARLNAALAAKVQELSRYRSDFPRKALGSAGRQAVHQGRGRPLRPCSRNFCSKAEARTSPARARRELNKVADLIGQLNEEIPPQVDWVLRVDDIPTPCRSRRRCSGPTGSCRPRAPPPSCATWSNWAFRPDASWRLVSGSFRPVDRSGDVISMQKNRRIEFKLTEP